MRLVKLFLVLITIHVGLGFTTMAAAYFGGDVPKYGAAGWISHTPIGEVIDLDAGVYQEEQVNLSALDKTWAFLNGFGDMINSLASFNYKVLTDYVEPDDGLVYMVVIIFRIAAILFGLALGLALVYVLFDSNLLTSATGLAIVGVGAGLTGVVSAVGALTPG